MTQEFTTQELCETSAGYWAVYNKIRLQADIFSFGRRQYQKEWMNNTCRQECHMKATQGGVSEAVGVLKSLHGLIYKKYKRGVLYMFPSSDDVLEFGKSRFSPLISQNHKAIGQYVRSAGQKGTNTASLKRVHDAYLYLRGARITQKKEDSGQGSSKLSGIPVDRCVFDEVDLMDDEVIIKALERMGDSEVKEEVYIGNPRVPGSGIDAVFQRSDQRHLFRKCSSCGEWTCAELFFSEDPEKCVGIRDDGTGYIRCQHCEKEVGLTDVKWIPQVIDSNIKMRGYRWSQLSSMVNDPAEILEQYRDPPQGNITDVYRLRLGLPYVPVEDMMTPERVMRCFGTEMMAQRHKGPCAMGVDVGKIKHVVIGTKTGTDQYEVIKVIAVSKWNDIHDLARKYNVKSAVIDIRPYEDAARKFQEAEPYRIFLCEYKENFPNGTEYNTKSGIVKQQRTEIHDATHRLIDEQMIKFPRRSPVMDLFTKQYCNTAKILEEDKRTGVDVFRYRVQKKALGDHFRQATNYFLLAARGGRLATVTDYDAVPQDAISEYAII